MAKISWGKCNLLVCNIPDNVSEYDVANYPKFIKVDTPVNGSTTINIEDGEKHEAEIEGGDNEAVRYDNDKFSLEFDIRRAADRPTIGKNAALGNQSGVYAFALQAEDPSAPSILVEAANVKRGISFTSADGIYDHYVVDAITPKDAKALKIGIVSMGTNTSANVKAKVNTPTAVTGAAGTECFIAFDQETASYANKTS